MELLSIESVKDFIRDALHAGKVACAEVICKLDTREADRINGDESE